MHSSTGFSEIQAMASEQFGQTLSRQVSLRASDTQTSPASPQQFKTDAERAAYRAETDRLASELTELAGQLNAGNYRFLVLLAQFDQRKGWSDGATHSCAHWLNWKLGLNLNAAREKIRVAHALESLPQISAAFARGQLSYSMARAITRVADAATESYFLSVASHGTVHHVEKLVRGYRRAQDAAELSREAQQQASRSLAYGHDEDGSLVMKVRLPAEIGALVLKALEAAVVQQDPPDVSPETRSQRPSRSAQRADALGQLAESFLKSGPHSLTGGERQQIVVHVDAETLRGKIPGRCELEDGPGVSAETSRRLACDASVIRIIEDEDGEPLNVGRKTRTIPPAIRRALNSRDKGCRFPGCTHTRYVDGHHIHHWANGGETKLSNLVLLCRFHHRLVHEGGVGIQTLDDGALRFVRPDGRCFDSTSALPVQSDWTELRSSNQKAGLHIDHKTASTRWKGESMDYGFAVQALMQRWEHAKNVSAETPPHSPPRS
jgi:hypothetical protein